MTCIVTVTPRLCYMCESIISNKYIINEEISFSMCRRRVTENEINFLIRKQKMMLILTILCSIMLKKHVITPQIRYLYIINYKPIEQKSFSCVISLQVVHKQNIILLFPFVLNGV